VYRIGIDVGGTFTDCILIDEETGQTVTTKTPTTDRLIDGIGSGFETLLQRAGISRDDVRSLSHGSTVAVNALIEETGAKTALVTTSGFRDVLEIGRGNRDESLLYNPCGEYQSPLVPRRRRYEVEERLTADGEVVTPLDEAALRDIAADMVADDVESVAVCFLHAYENDVHERQAAAILADAAPELTVSRSSTVAPVIREYRRLATTVVDAYLKPVVSDYLAELDDEITASAGIPPVYIMQSDGGVAGPDLVSRRPSSQLISGPVAAVNSCEWLGSQTGLDQLITMDMGGTSCDTAIIENGTARTVADREMQGMRIRGPFVDIRTVGSGGGSIASIDDVGALRVGPDSAGARPGPVCYGRGGTDPTVTDADLLLGFLRPHGFAGGTFDLDREAAERQVRQRIAEPLDMSVREAAASIRTLVDSQMAAAVRTVTIENGADPRACSLMAFGGAGPMHACNVATQLGVETICFPATAGLLSATGVAVSDIRHEYVRSVLQPVPAVTAELLTEIATSLGEQAQADLDDEAVANERRRFELRAEMRYEGQSHNLEITVARGRERIDALTSSITAATTDEIAAQFKRDHERTYGFTDDENPIRIISASLVATGVVDQVEFDKRTNTTRVADARQDTRTVVTDGGPIAEVPFYKWEALPPDQQIAGPAVIEADHTTAWLRPEFTAQLDPEGTIIATRTQ